MKTILKVLVLLSVVSGAPLNAAVVLLVNSYTQDFDSFGSSSVAWTDNSTLAGWTINSEAFSSPILANTGSGATGGVFSYGSASSSERALGYLGSSGNDYTNFYLQIQNDTGSVLTGLNISFDGELWRSGGAQTASSNNTINFYYATGTPTLVATSSTSGWTSISALNYAPTVSVGAGALLGTATTRSFSLTGLSVAVGDSIYLRWLGGDGVGSDAGLAIDNVAITAMTTVPEPSSLALIGLGTTFLLYRRKRKA